jgi:hypothetical protein
MKNGGPIGMTRFPINTGRSELEQLKLQIKALEMRLEFIESLILKNIPETKKKK